MSEFEDQVVLVTGASRGIGLAIAEDFAAQGASVALAARSRGAIEKAADRLDPEGRKALAVPMDVTSAEGVRSAVESVLERFSKVDILVNNAGIARDGLLLRMKDDDWEAVLSTNLDGAFRVTRAVLPGMLRQRYGRIINISSVVGLMGNPGQVNYVASKAGLIGFTRALAREVASRNITVNAVAPGFVETDMTAELGEKASEQMRAQIPLKRPGSAPEIAFGVRFLASRMAGYITGHVLNINGGMYM